MSQESETSPVSNTGLTVVLGGAGFLGSHLTEALLGAGRKVRVFDRENVDLRNLEHLSGDWELVGGDFLSESDQRRAIEGASVVFHLISTTIPASSNQDPAFDVETNLLPTVRMLELARETGVRKIVYASSGGTVYGRPGSVPVGEDHPTHPLVSYGVIKLAAEKYLSLYRELHGLPYAVTRLSNPYGPRQNPHGAQGAASVFLGRALRGEPIEVWGDGTVVRDYLYVSDAVAGILAAERHPGGEGVFNIGSGVGVSLNELVAEIRSVTGREVEVRYRSSRPFDIPVNVLDNSRARRELGWTPKVALGAGLRLTWQWLRGGREHP
jgi:UDP-glucose 4-epimerase